MGSGDEFGRSSIRDRISTEDVVGSLDTPLLSKDSNKGDVTLNETLAGEEVPVWSDQITLRGIVVSILLGTIFCIITHKLNFVIGIIPSMNVGGGLLAFFFIKTWTTTLSKLGIWTKPFTRQENTVILTTTVACYGLAFSGGFGSYLAAMNEKTYNIVGVDYPGNHAEDVKNPSLGWMIGFLFTVSFVGILALIPLRKIMVIEYGLTYPSGTATAMLINSFHTREGAETASKQVKCLGKYFSISFLWSFFKWFFSGVGDSCGFDNFPSFGLTAFSNKIYFDFKLTYIGVGMISPRIVVMSMVFGALFSWGVMWPLIATKAGHWFPDGLGPTDFKGLYAYKVFLAIALVLGDGLYNIMKIVIVSGKALHSHHRASLELPVITGQQSVDETADEKKRTEVFLRDGIPLWIVVSGYVALAAISITLIPQIFPVMKWYFVFLCYLVAPLLGFCNSYGSGLTDWSLPTAYGKLAIFIFASLAGSDGGVLIGLTACGVIFSVVSAASELMHDMKCAHLTLSSPKSMFVSQLIGTAFGCIIAPLTYWVFWTAFDLGSQAGEYKVPNAIIFREMAILGVAGLSALPDYCLQMFILLFFLAVLLNIIRDLGPKEYTWFIPIPMAMSIPFYIGAAFAIDMFIGTVIKFVWEKINKKEVDIYAVVLASGLVSGDGLWTVPAAALSLSKINPPICMTFLPAAVGSAGLVH